jgi:hypothetical protein
VILGVPQATATVSLSSFRYNLLIMKRTKFMALLFLSGILAFASCKKDDTNDPEPTDKPGNNPTTPETMPSMTGTWKATGTDMAKEDQGSFSEATLTIDANNNCTWYKKNPSNSKYSLTMTGTVSIEVSGAKDANGKPIDRIWFAFTKINGEALSGTTFGIYQIVGSTFTLDWMFMKNGEQYADPTKGFGSSRSGQNSVSRYTRQ